jgi:hypothetical protein
MVGALFWDIDSVINHLEIGREKSESIALMRTPSGSIREMFFHSIVQPVIAVPWLFSVAC